MPSSRGNVGNWSELYALASLLVNRGAHGPRTVADLSNSMFFRVLEINVEDSNPSSTLHYQIGENEVLLHRSGAMTSLLDIPRISEAMAELSNDLKSDSATRHFSTGAGEKLLHLLGKQSIGASSSQRISDFELIIADPQTNNPSPRTGYSVKSSVGSPATLLNASGATNFIFEITHPNSLNPTDFLEGHSLANHVRQLLKSGFAISFRSMQSPVFGQNLMRVDSLMPELVAEVLLNSFKASVPNTFASAVENTFSNQDPLGKQRIFKMKQLLGSIAMGLRPTESWDGDSTKFKGMIHVDQNLNLIFNYQHNQIDFWDYLFANLKFETASRSRHGYGHVYSDDGKFYIKLNLQIRFIR
jgi:hypothetical protein